MITFFTEYFVAFIVGVPLFFFIIGVGLRLLDRSAAIFMEHEILVSSSYVTSKEIKSELAFIKDPSIIKAFRKVLILRKAHDLCMLIAVITTVYLIGYLVWDFFLRN